MADGDWSYRVIKLERIEADRADHQDDVFSVDFTLDGPSASAEVEIMVVDPEDEAGIIAMAMSALHAALQAWVRATAERRIDGGRGTPN